MTSLFLVFQIYGPMASWGEIALGEERDTAGHPTRSAVLGLCAAALGIWREKEQELLALNRDLGFGLCVEHSGDLLRDFHTVEIPVGKKGRGLSSRQEELAFPRREAMLTARNYRTDGVYTIALWERSGQSGGGRLLRRLQTALREPQTMLYLGRKSCPIALPLNPRLLQAATMLEAIQKYPISEMLQDLEEPFQARAPMEKRFYWDADTGDMKPGVEILAMEKRWDYPVSRRRWNFSWREEAMGRALRGEEKEI